MELNAQTLSWLRQVKESLTPKPGVLGKLFGSKSDSSVVADKTILSGVKLDQYTFGDLIGVGGAGAVFECTDASKGGQALAIKVLGRPEEASPGEDALFEREVEIGRTLSHPTAVRTLDTKSNEIARFLVMERVSGQELTSELGEAWSKDRVLAVFGPLAEGLQHAHDLGVVHRDLKPDNVMLTDSGEVKILDFGMAQLKGAVEVTLTGQFKGTPMYTSPEQIQDTKHIPPTCDQFAYGMMVFEALTGQLPYTVDRKDPMAAIFARLQQPAARLQTVLPEASDDLDAVLAKMLAQDPKARYSDMSEAFQALETVLK